MVPVCRHAGHRLARLAGGGLVLAFAIAALSRKGKVNRYSNGQESDHNQQPPKRKPPSHSYREYDHPTEEEHRTAEQFSWRKSLKVNFLIAVVVAATFGVAFKTYQETVRQADIAQSSLMQSQRAWIDIAVSSSSLIWNTENATIYTFLTASNEGNSPAISTTIFSMLYRDKVGSAAELESATYNACFADDVGRVGGPTIFTKAPYQVNYGSGGSAEIIKWIRDIRRTAIPDEYKTIPLEVLVCVKYRIVQDAKFHHTVHVYYAIVSSPAGAGIPKIGQDYPAGQLTLQRAFAGDYAD